MSDSSPSPLPILARCSTCSTFNRADLSRLASGPKCASCGNPLALDRPQPVTDADFQRLIDGASVPVLVDFHAEWCGPCHAMAPVLDEFARSRAGHLLALKLDTDANPVTAQRFAIRGIPTLIAFRNGRELRRHVGLADRRTLEALVA